MKVQIQTVGRGIDILITPKDFSFEANYAKIEVIGDNEILFSEDIVKNVYVEIKGNPIKIKWDIMVDREWMISLLVEYEGVIEIKKEKKNVEIKGVIT